MKILHDLRAILRLTPLQPWTTPAMVAIGVASALAETFGVTLVVLFLYSAMGQSDSVGAMGGTFGKLLEALSGRLQGGVSVAGLIFALIVLRGLLAYAYNLISAATGSRISEHARNSVHAQYLDVSYAYMRRHDQGQLLDLLATESWAVAAAHASLARLAISACSLLVFMLFLCSLSWRIALTAVIGSGAISLGLRGLTAGARRLGVDAKAVNQGLAERILVTLQGMRTIRAYGQEQVFHAAFLKSSSQARDTTFKLERLFAFLSPATEIGYLAVLIFIVSYPALMQASFATTLGAVALLYRVQPHIREIEASLLSLAQLGPAVRAVLAMVQRDDKTYSPVGKLHYVKAVDGIRFDGVTLKYEASDSAALNQASFRIPAGKTTALVGVSGAGKTTIVSLLLRLYQPTSGQILVDGVALDDIRREEWLSHLAVAGQDIDLTEGTIADNIRMARNEATDAAVAEAARLAGLTAMVDALPDGYESWIGQQGMNLSGGQRQRIGLARAILRDPDLLILDEATSALDRGLEEDIRTALAERFAGRSILLITHRVETVLSADHIICMQDGCVAEEGPSVILLKRPEGVLRRLLQRGATAAG
jgi:ABC-type multidrug transport system fused ATPase/permease subunit